MDDTETLFFESYAAAQSLKSTWTRLASTYGCMMVFLSRETLTIRPHWFAGWLISLLCLDLTHHIPIKYIEGVTEAGKWYGYGKVELEFLTAHSEKRRIFLYLKNYRKFIAAVNNIKRGVEKG